MTSTAQLSLAKLIPKEGRRRSVLSGQPSRQLEEKGLRSCKGDMHSQERSWESHTATPPCSLATCGSQPPSPPGPSAQASSPLSTSHFP